MTEPTDLEWTITLHIPTAAGPKVLDLLYQRICVTAVAIEQSTDDRNWEIYIDTYGPQPAEEIDNEEVES